MADKLNSMAKVGNARLMDALTNGVRNDTNIPTINTSLFIPLFSIENRHHKILLFQFIS